MNAFRCPDEAAWSEFLSDDVLASDEHELSQHLQGCQDCRQLLESLMTLARPPVEPAASCSDAVDANAPHLSALKQRVLRLMETPQPAAAEMDTQGWAETRARRELPERVGRFQIQGRLGEGGFGLVLLAYDPLLRRQVALKLPRALLVADSQQEVRFLREARAAAGLTHPHIVPVYEVGREGDQYFFSMGYVEGESLYARIDRDGPLAPAQAARLMEQIAEAVEYAHRRGVVHRDLKPQNVLLAKAGQPLVTDFGLAKQVSEADELTVSGQVMGTPSYMSPEQAQGQLEEVGPHSDVYSLGAMLYHMLTGRPPFSAANVMETLKQVTESEPVPPRKVDPHIPRDLETIALKCLDKSPRRRYPSAAALAQELRRFQDGEPILARPITRTERTWRWVRRRPAVAVLGALFVLALIVGTTASTLSHFRERASELRQRALERRERALQLDVALNDAQKATMSGDLNEADGVIARAERLGAPEWQIKMLRAQTAYFRGEYEDAVKWLEQTARLQPDSVAVQALLAAACVAAGKWKQYEPTLDKLSTLTPATQEDYLFKGLAESYLKPELGLESLDLAVKLKNSEMARLIRAEVRCSLARDTAKLEDAEAAVEDARIALSLLEKHAAALVASLKANLTAAGVYQSRDLKALQDEALQRAADNAAALEPFVRGGPSAGDAGMPLVAVDLAIYHQVKKHDPLAIQVLRDAGTGQPLIDYNLALALYRTGKPDQAFELLDPAYKADNLTDNARWLYIWLLMEPTVNVDRQRVRDAYDALKKREASGLEVLFRPCLLLLLGDRESAITESFGFSPQQVRVPSRSEFYGQLLAYNRDEIKFDALLKEAGPSMWDRCEAYFFIALHHLADGKRDEARQHFGASVATRCYGVQAWDWSTVALARMSEDDAWPPWIEMK